MLKAAAYARYSTDNQTENSIAYQMDAIQHLCKDRGLTLLNVYADEAKSGFNINRDILASVTTAKKSFIVTLASLRKKERKVLFFSLHSIASGVW